MRSEGPPERPGLGIGWFQGTTRTADRAWMLGQLGLMFGTIKLREFGSRWYARSAAVGPLGVRVEWEPRSGSSNAAEVYTVVPQAALDVLGWDGQVCFLRLMGSLGVKASRVDVWYDDRARIVDPAVVHDALEAGQKRSHVRSYERRSNSAGGFTCYIGSREGEVYVRSYRKWAEGGDPRQGVRWEMESKGDRAPVVVDLMLGSKLPAVAFWSVMRSFCDFVDRTGHVRGDEAPLLAWWVALVGSADRVKLCRPLTVDSMARRLTWLRRQAAPSLALVFQSYGSACISELIADGYARAPAELMAATT